MSPWNFIFQEPHFHSEILELHGFNFELKAVRRDGTYFFSIKVSMLNFSEKILSSDNFTFFSILIYYFQSGIPEIFLPQRISPSDPVLSFKQCQRQAFSMRQNRKVCFCIKVQFIDECNRYQVVSSGMLVETLGVGSKSSKSKVQFQAHMVSSKISMYKTIK